MRHPHASNPPARRFARAFAAGLLSVVVLAGCAGPRMGPGGPPGGPGGGRPAAPALFVSPFGELFVGAPGNPWPTADWFIGADEDLDGVLVFDEFAADGRRWFDHLDADRDGRLGQAELWTYEAALRQYGGGPGGGPGGGSSGPGGGPGGGPAGLAPQTGPGGGPPGGSRAGPDGGGPPRSRPRRQQSYGLVAEAGFFNLPQPVKAADVNVDQRVTAEEWAAATQRWFLALDTDRDGRLTMAGLPETPLQRRAEARR
ncbi:hypothetical protein [Brevundimonas sp.]|uniref:hypothetical protein n=1 Tax=Brevundimonas sp. TaxID=1871086 RepID=UPI0027380352|nr:hypothetical protein [Brevundimonas sp.]MDP3802689.1 hypothetical protein [Brevundimonas sp.]